MDALRRGWVGLALFLAALIMMPLLVVEYHERTSRDAAVMRADGTSLVPPVPHPVTLRTNAPGEILAFSGVSDGETISGFRHISLETDGEIGEIHYVLTGPTGMKYPLTAAHSPYLFAPHQTGWETTAVIDGQYSLQASAQRPGVTPKTINFAIGNARAGSSGASRST